MINAKKQIELLQDLYDVIRIVNPITNEVILHTGRLKIENNGKCCGILGRKKVCTDCIGIKAYRENNTFMKIALFNKNKIFMIVASPIKIKGERYVLETFKEITTENILEKHNDDEDLLDTMFSNIEELLMKDELTKAYNRRYMSKRLLLDIANCKAQRVNACIMMFDVDNFKLINDSYGHIVGDKVLKEIVRIISRLIEKDNAWIARYGGDEFILVLNNVSKKKGLAIANKIKTSIEKHEFIFKGENIKVTISLGVGNIEDLEYDCLNVSDEEYCIDEIIDYVDSKLYKAKSLGKNNVYE
ncbi:GGDEF domain-containing protein [Clostridium oceanicum]|uniref:GGDEF domain-containing protein n=1 Tax=Clostridium oceanicum TaxID=1543 RepID=A0ABN1JI25_9CLOT